jgi:hypothetical protein
VNSGETVFAVMKYRSRAMGAWSGISCVERLPAYFAFHVVANLFFERFVGKKNFIGVVFCNENIGVYVVQNSSHGFLLH